MSGDASELLMWARGPGFSLAVAIFLFGMVLRLFEVLALGRKKDLSTPRNGTPGSGLRTVVTRSVTCFSVFSPANAITFIAGYLFHIGLFVVVLLFVPHIELLRSLLGFGWPGLPSTVVDMVTLITILALIAMLIDRLVNPVKRLISTFGDYLAWTLSILPLLTGYMAYHHLVEPYALILALHILSAELLLALLPFTRLVHAMTIFISRWYTGSQFARKGVAS
jgi:nitrate reductase gamma subunit